MIGPARALPGGALGLSRLRYTGVGTNLSRPGVASNRVAEQPGLDSSDRCNI